MTDLASLEVTQRDGAIVGRLSGEIDLSNAAALEESLIRAADGGAALVVDLSSLSYMDSAGIAMLQRVSQAVGAAGGSVRLVVGPEAKVRRVLMIARMDVLLPMHDQVSDAVRGLELAPDP